MLPRVKGQVPRMRKESEEMDEAPCAGVLAGSSSSPQGRGWFEKARKF
jgi:hypothetical protein